MLRWIAVVTMVCGCPTPYQQMGFSGGVSTKPLGNGTFVINVAVNGYTSQGTAIEYAYRRAGEMCPGGYQLADRASSSTSSYMRTQYGVQEINKPEVTLVVQCNAARPTETSAAGRPEIDNPVISAQPDAHWWCSSSVLLNSGACFRGGTACESYYRSMNSDGVAMKECRPQAEAACFNVTRISDGGTDAFCNNDMSACRAQFDFVTTNRTDVVRAVGECHAVR